MMEDKEILTLEQVAKRLKKSRRTVERMLKEGKLQGVRVGSGRGQWRFRASDIDIVLGVLR